MKKLNEVWSICFVVAGCVGGPDGVEDRSLAVTDTGPAVAVDGITGGGTYLGPGDTVPPGPPLPPGNPGGQLPCGVYANLCDVTGRCLPDVPGGRTAWAASVARLANEPWEDIVASEANLMAAYQAFPLGGNYPQPSCDIASNLSSNVVDGTIVHQGPNIYGPLRGLDYGPIDCGMAYDPAVVPPSGMGGYLDLACDVASTWTFYLAASTL